VLAEAAATAVFALAPHLLVLADTATATVFALTPLPLVLAEAAATAVFARAPAPLVLAEAAAAAVFALAPHSLVLAEAAASAVFAPAPHALVLAQGRGLAGLLGCRRMWCRSCARCIGWVHTTLFVLAALSLWPSGPLQHSLLARRGSNPHVEAFCALGVMLPLPRGAYFARPDR